MSKDTELLKELTDFVEYRAKNENMIADVVDDLRLNGVSWSKIAAVLGVSKQAAQQRYGVWNDRPTAKVVQIPDQESIPVDPQAGPEPENQESTTVDPKPARDGQESGVQFPGPVNFQIPEGEQQHEDRIKCPCCMASVGKTHGKKTAQVLSHFHESHAIESNGKCKVWNDLKLTEPYYTATAAPWATGWTTKK